MQIPEDLLKTNAGSIFIMPCTALTPQHAYTAHVCIHLCNPAESFDVSWTFHTRAATAWYSAASLPKEWNCFEVATCNLQAGDVLHLSAGTFKLSRILPIAGCILMGAGNDQTIIERGLGKNNLFVILTKHVMLENICISANDTMFVIAEHASLTLRNVSIKGTIAQPVMIAKQSAELILDGCDLRDLYAQTLAMVDGNVHINAINGTMMGSSSLLIRNTESGAITPLNPHAHSMMRLNRLSSVRGHFS